MNARRSSITSTDIEAAIESSGYPLQIRVAGMLASDFEVSEEWGYADRTTGALRTLDLRAVRRLPMRTPALKVYPSLSLLIECKKSPLPYVFFRSAERPLYTHFPQIDGLRSSEITVFQQLDERTVTPHIVPISAALGLLGEPFIADGPPVCATLSKIVRQRDRFELSGSDAYHELLLPMVSAMVHSSTERRPSRSAGPYEPSMCLSVAVVDAPLVMYDTVSRAQTEAQWVRVVRREPADATADRPGARRSMAIDIVNVDFLNTFVETHLLPFAMTFSTRVEGAFRILDEGVCHLNRQDWTWRDITGLTDR